MGGPVTDPDRLGSRGQLHITDAAARAYAADLRLDGPNEARLELLRLLPDAKQTKTALPGDHIEQWRYRRGAEGVDISARVTYERGLVVVVSARGRTLNQRGRAAHERGQQRRRDR